MPRRLLTTIVLASALALASAGCPLVLPVPPQASGSPATAGQSAASPPVQPDAGQYTGQVLDLSGAPAVNVLVRGYLVSNAAYVSPYGGGLAAGDGERLNNAAPLAAAGGPQAPGAGSFRVLGASPAPTPLPAPQEARTDDRGLFRLAHPAGQALNIEAIQGEDVRAIRLDVPAGATGLTLQLAYTGSIAGQVTARSAPAVNNFEGVDVFVPGTSYAAKADRIGRYSIPNVAAGTFALVAAKSGSRLGRAALSGVKVESRKATEADLDLVVDPPRIGQVVPRAAAAGSAVVVSGEGFGASSGEITAVTLDGVTITGARVDDDATIRFVLPPGRHSGDLVVSTSGVESAPMRLEVVLRLAIDQPALTLLPGTSRQYTATAWNGQGGVVPDAVLTWEASGAVTVDASGRAAPAGTGDGLLRASLGAVQATASVRAAPTLGIVSTVAGGEAEGDANGPGGTARFSYPTGLAVDPAGALYVGDSGNHRIRRIDPGGSVSTVAGSRSFGGRDGVGAAAEFYHPRGVALAPDGKLYVVDQRLSTIRRVVLPAGLVSTPWSGGLGFADGAADQALFAAPWGIAADHLGNLYVGDTQNNRVRKIAPSGEVSTLAGQREGGFADGVGDAAAFDTPWGIAVGPDGYVHVADTFNHRIRVIR